MAVGPAQITDWTDVNETDFGFIGVSYTAGKRRGGYQGGCYG